MTTRRAIGLKIYAKPGRGLLKRPDQRLRRERLCQVGDTSGFQGGHANGMVVVGGDINDRNGNSRGFEAPPHLDPGLVVQVDVENDAKRLVEVAVILKSLCRLEQHAVIAMLPQQSFHPS